MRFISDSQKTSTKFFICGSIASKNQLFFVVLYIIKKFGKLI